jgi:rod shape-determining protein MreC
MLISDKKSFFDAKIQEKEIPGLIKGRGNLKIIFDLIPRDKEVSEGDTIVTTSLAGISPAGILIGKVSSVKKNDVEPFQQIEVKPAFEIGEIDYLFIIKDVWNEADINADEKH